MVVEGAEGVEGRKMPCSLVHSEDCSQALVCSEFAGSCSSISSMHDGRASNHLARLLIGADIPDVHN